MDKAAFPTNGADYQDGMNLRDYFAGSCANAVAEFYLTQYPPKKGQNVAAMIAISVYEVADAMMTVREVKL